MKRTASEPTSSTTSRSVTKSPERFDMLHRLAVAQQLHQAGTILTSSVALPAVTALTPPACA
jgi:hypothetical protein